MVAVRAVRRPRSSTVFVPLGAWSRNETHNDAFKYKGYCWLKHIVTPAKTQGGRVGPERKKNCGIHCNKQELHCCGTKAYTFLGMHRGGKWTIMDV